MANTTFTTAGVTSTALQTEGLAVGNHRAFIVNLTKSAVTVDDVTSSSDALTFDVDFPVTIQSGGSYNFVATATGANHTLSIAAGAASARHTAAAVDSANTEDQLSQRLYFGVL